MKYVAVGNFVGFRGGGGPGRGECAAYVLQRHPAVVSKALPELSSSGEIGPMPLLTYEGTRPWAKAIKAAVASRKMPPWFADPAFGHFMEDRRMRTPDLNRIVAWVDAGGPAGDMKDQPAAVAWPRDGTSGRTKFFRCRRVTRFRLRGRCPMCILVIPTGFVRDTWVTAAELRPSNRSVVHHIIAVVRPPGSQWMKQAKPLGSVCAGARKIRTGSRRLGILVDSGGHQLMNCWRRIHRGCSRSGLISIIRRSWCRRGRTLFCRFTTRRMARRRWKIRPSWG